MRAAAAGVLLDRDARAHDVERLRPRGQDLRRVVVARAVEDVEEALLVLEGGLVRREPVAREQRGEETVPRAVADVQRLHHRAEVGLDAGSERRRDGERGGDLVVRQLHQLRARGGAAEHAERRGRVPAVRVVIEVHAQPELALGLEAGDVGGDEIAAARAGVVGERDQRRQDGRGRMAADRVVAVVEIERVRGGAVHQRGVERADTRRGAEHERGPGARVAQEDVPRDTRRVLARARQGHADVVEDADLRPMNCRWRQFIIGERIDTFREFECEGHGCPPDS